MSASDYIFLPSIFATNGEDTSWYVLSSFHLFILYNWFCFFQLVFFY